MEVAVENNLGLALKVFVYFILGVTLGGEITLQKHTILMFMYSTFYIHIWSDEGLHEQNIILLTLRFHWVCLFIYLYIQENSF